MVWAVTASVVLGGIESVQVAGDKVILGSRSVSLLPRDQSKKGPWLGVSVQKPGSAMEGRSGGVPKGVGFVVREVAGDSPAARAGLRDHDVLWKLNEQLLINEAQFLVLLHHHRVGDTVRLVYMREGGSHEVEVTLGERPVHRKGRKQADTRVTAGPPLPGMTEQYLQSIRQEASLRLGDGSIVRLRRKGPVYHWVHSGNQGSSIAEGTLSGLDDPGLGKLTGKLNTTLRALIRVFDNAELRAGARATAPARVRRVARPMAGEGADRSNLRRPKDPRPVN